ncbi:MAG: UvrD-helicase domain-containing protein [Chloroflexia bacterium]
MLPETLFPQQQALVEAPTSGGETCFLSGPTGAGKSTALLARLAYLLRQGVPAYSILVLLPDRPAVERLQRALRGIPLGPYGELSIHTYYSLAQRMVALFWPLVARPAGFAHPERPPIFLPYDLAQYLLGEVIRPLLDRGYFEGLHLHPQRLLSQILDNLNKAALNGYPLAEVVVRLSSAWSGPPERLLLYQQAQECCERFRDECLRRGLLDLSLTLEVFSRLLDHQTFSRYFRERYRHLLADNVEENVPIVHDFVARLLPGVETALLVYDESGGYRTLLGADPDGARTLRQACRAQVRWSRPPWPAASLAAAVAHRLGQSDVGPERPGEALLGAIARRYRGEMITAVAERLAHMVHEERIPPEEIAVLAPYLDGVLRFTLAQECAARRVPLAVLRRYRRLVEEPAVRALLTFATLHHPEWNLPPPPFDVAEALGQALDLDPARAALLADWVYDAASASLRSPEALPSRAGARLGPVLLTRYRAFWERWGTLRPTASLPWEQLLAQLLATLLPGAARDPAAALACAQLLEAARRFRHLYPALSSAGGDAGRAHLELLRAGVVTAQYAVSQKAGSAVLLAPAHTYLVAGHPVRRQFWLDVGSVDWWEPPQQPLTNPYVLARRWPAGALWSDAADYYTRQAQLARIVQGLCERCTEGVVIAWSEWSTAGQPQEGPLLRALEPFLP